MTTNIINEMMKSISLDSTGVRGMMILGKYTFVKIFALLTKLVLEAFIAPEKCHQHIVRGNDAFG